MPDLIVFKGGRLPRRDDPRTLQLAHYIGAVSQAPDAVDYTSKVTEAWGMLGNDTVGDCTCAAAAHTIMEWVANATGTQVPFAAATVLGWYSAITGYNPNDPNSDQGANELDVLNFWRKNGLSSHILGAYAAVDVANQAEVRTAVWVCGVVYIGFEVFQSAMDQFNLGQSWDVAADPGQDLGGHAVPVVGYNATGPVVITWGKAQQMTWAFWAKYVDEAYGLVSTDELGAQSPFGVDLASLEADLTAISRNQPDPGPSPAPPPAPPTPPGPTPPPPVPPTPPTPPAPTDQPGLEALSPDNYAMVVDRAERHNEDPAAWLNHRLDMIRSHRIEEAVAALTGD